MKTIALDDAPAKFRSLVRAASRENVVVTQHGRPVAMIVPVGTEQRHPLAMEESPEEFWRMIQQRRRSSDTVPFDVVRAEIAARQSAERTRTQRDRSSTKKKGK